MDPPVYAPEDVQAAFAAVLVDEWARAGVTEAVASPGSRSTPLLVALAEAAEAGQMRLHVFLDERAAGFFALGLGLASGMPAPVVTTSGTAAVELHPAIVEAHHAGVPLLAVTTDRPPELHDCGAPQTVHQQGLYGDAVRWAFSPGVPDVAGAGTWRSLASRAVAEARGGLRRPGPVHLNLAFREPLIGEAAAFLGAVGGWSASSTGSNGAGLGGPRARPGPAASLVASGRRGAAPWHDVAGWVAPVVPDEVVRAAVQAGERGLVVAGAGAGSGAAVRELARATGWPVLASPTSGYRTEGAVCAADALLRAPAVRQWRPDLVVRLGQPWASRVVAEWLADLDCPQVLVDPWGVWAAPDHLASHVVQASPDAFCHRVALAVASKSSGARCPSTGDWPERWGSAEAAAQRAIDEVLAGEETLSEPAVARSLVRSLPDGSTLVVASSMPVREVEWWGGPRESLRALSNRGANGIDGVLSTALGVAAAAAGRGASSGPAARSGAAARSGGSADGGGPAGSVRPASSRTAGGEQGRVVALVGDLAFAYDASALLWAADRELSLDVVVLDNNGGGIFSFLPQASSQPAERFERLWGTPHGTDLVALARAYGVKAERLEDVGLLERAVSSPSGPPGVRVWVAKTSRSENVAVHRRLWSAVEAAVAEVSS